MSRELYINDRLLDLDEETVIAITFQVNDIGEIKDRQANFSNQFSLPATASNIKNLGFVNLVGSNSFLPYRKTKCNYFQNGVQLVQNGVLIIDGFDGSIFNVTVYSGIYDFFFRLEGKTLRDIDFSENDFTWSNSEILDVELRYTLPSTSFLEETNVCVPILDYGTKTVADFRYQFPAMRYKYILSKIFEFAEYDYSGEIFDDDICNALALTLKSTVTYDEEAVLLSRSFNGTLSENIFFSLQYVLTNILSINTNFAVTDYFNSSAGALIIDTSKPSFTTGNSFNAGISMYIFRDDNLSRTRYKSLSYNNVDVDISIHFPLIKSNTTTSPINGADKIFSKINVLKNGIIIRSFPIDTFEEFPSPYDFSASFSLDLKPNDEIMILFLTSKYSIEHEVEFGDIIYESCKVSFTATNTVKLDQPIKFNSLMPATPLVDVVKTFCQLFGIIIISNDYNLRFVKLKEIARGSVTPAVRDDTGIFLETPIYEDWSDKLDLSKPISLVYRIGSYGQSNELKYSSDESTNGYGDSIFEVDDTTLPLKSTMFELPYSSALESVISVFNTVKIPAFTKYESDEWDSDNDYIEGDEVSYGGIVYTCINDNIGSLPPSNPLDWNVRLEQYEYTEDSNNRLILIRRGTVSETVPNRNVAYFNDPNQQMSLVMNYLISLYYKDLINMLKNHKSVDCYLTLNDSDINKLDFTKAKYIKYFGEFFYLNTVNEYIEGQPTSCRLIRL